MSAADLVIRIDQLENQIRQLTGAVEQLQYRNQQLEQSLRKMQEDNEFRFQELGGKGAARGATRPVAAPPAHSAATAAAVPAAAAISAAACRSVRPPLRRVRSGAESDRARRAARARIDVIGARRSRRRSTSRRSARPAAAPAGAPLDLSTMAANAASDPALGPAGGAPSPDGGPLPPPPPRNPSATGGRLATLPPTQSPRDEYDLAYGYILRKDYALAEEAFRDFLKKYPTDRMGPDAQFWLGESLFQRQSYRDAAEAFLNMSKKYEHSPKAPDALLRLGQSLAALKREGTGLRHLRRGRSQIPPRLHQREAGGRAGTKACPLLRRASGQGTPVRRPGGTSHRHVAAPAGAIRSSIRTTSAAVFLPIARRPSPMPRPIACSPTWPTNRRWSLRSPAVPISTALLVLAARWRKRLKSGRSSSPSRSTTACGRSRVARRRPSSGSPAARRCASHDPLERPQAVDRAAGEGAPRALSRLGEAARRVRARCMLTAHTLDDQAETVLIRMARGSGLTGLGGDGGGDADGRLFSGPAVARRAESAAGRDRCMPTDIAFADDPSNRDPRFTRARLRGVMPALRAEGLDARRLALLARRVRRADAAIEAVTDAAGARLALDLAASRLPAAAVDFDRDSIRSPAGGDCAAAARPRHCAGRRRGAGRARQARSR